ncbi:MAG TPA: tryptophan 2,3-dioxygenase family protein [Blastocatellia bacterium]|jgi:tryptophan 2,3-dioxygenase|nr:tryptophan 2,3-dioxygenase family protein [Blastocatellia bacterium]
MSFGLPHVEEEERLTYGGYLKVRELISLQGLLSDPPQHDETLFIIIHQVFELWFKQLLHELDTIVERLNKDETLAAHRLLRRCIEIERVLVNQVGILETMTPMDFLAFRDHLRPASGFQSSQFREIETVSGLKDRRYLKSYQPGSDEYARIETRLGQPSLGDAFYELLRRRGFDLPASSDQALGEGGRDLQRERRVRELMRIYQDAGQHYDLFLLAESLVEYDEMFTLWRLRHVKMVERMIGGKTGTGGSDGAAYLMKTVERRFFPELWELRDYLGNAGDGCPMGGG